MFIRSSSFSFLLLLFPLLLRGNVLSNSLMHASCLPSQQVSNTISSVYCYELLFCIVFVVCQLMKKILTVFNRYHVVWLEMHVRWNTPVWYSFRAKELWLFRILWIFFFYAIKDVSKRPSSIRYISYLRLQSNCNASVQFWHNYSRFLKILLVEFNCYKIRWL